MKGKLHKMESGYILSLNGDIDDPYAIVNKELAEDYEWYKLSLKNCQAIELGYDLEELAKLFHEQHKFASSHIADITSFMQLFAIPSQKEMLDFFNSLKRQDDDDSVIRFFKEANQINEYFWMVNILHL